MALEDLANNLGKGATEFLHSPGMEHLGILALNAALIVGGIIIAGRYAYRRVFETNR